MQLRRKYADTIVLNTDTPIPRSQLNNLNYSDNQQTTQWNTTKAIKHRRDFKMIGVKLTEKLEKLG